jgi:hypothetical protein
MAEFYRVIIEISSDMFDISMMDDLPSEGMTWKSVSPESESKVG